MLEASIAFILIFTTGCASLAGVLFLSVKEKTLDKILFYLVAFATGTILGTAIFDLIPESIHGFEELLDEGLVVEEEMYILFVFLMVGFVAFFVLERFIYWFHGHAHEEGDDKVACFDTLGRRVEVELNGGKGRNVALLNLVGDSLHNLLDGIIIMVSFLSDMTLGFIVTVAVFIHEFPQEVGDFGILIYGGFTKKRALIANFVSAMIALVGGLVALLLSGAVATFNTFFLGFSAGGFIYIGAVELMPDLLKEKDLKRSILQSIIFIAGIATVFVLLRALPHV
ncbi:MAG: ZIP family metal transporter [Candidatus Lokiarchaeota archaeon]|nr:ZIP family metal transporter [Candidatus Lokiarchaeota archaeon]